eukprot:gene14383-14485_t
MCSGFMLQLTVYKDGQTVTVAPGSDDAGADAAGCGGSRGQVS